MSRSEIRKLGANGPAWLKVFPQLRDTDDPVLLQAAREAQPVSWSKGEYVFHEGDPCEQFVFALSGTTRVFKHESSGKQITLYRVNPGQSCAMTTACLLTGRPYQASATVESKVNATILLYSSSNLGIIGAWSQSRVSD